ncbi:glutathionyl-hydroquinone reductase-like [Raphidocelis subcapitata]|uniref:Glutathionyl-hydroquinone reductase-like n=1 Tax=Raphidocelis subcapitata TaxID=307507 RepID=A0A2V0NPW3_9CHLO|nr:glutathionyl-hydroquinone reductase-like [Raphidocelis subcapitata]|eukprot:GBF89678.1 glutathionyl-hydroquinone reductase-like [Raphidocelis subcapitata]
MATGGGAPRTAVDETSRDGAFVRTAAGFRSSVGDPGFEPAAGRYHLYISYACPWANRCLAVIYLKGLEDAVGVSVVHPTWQRTRPGDAGDAHTGWAFRAPGDPPISSSTGHGSFECDGCVPDPVLGAKFVRDIYEQAGDTTGKYSVPVLYDKQRRTIVNNESSEIMRQLNSAFNAFAKRPDLDLYPPHLRADIDAANEWIYPSINNGVYRCGFAQKQEPYEVAFKELFAALDRCEEVLSRQRYIAGPALTEADVRLYMTLIRFDPVYVVYFKTNARFIRDYPNLRGYVRDVHSAHGGAVGRSINMRHIKVHYFSSHPALNPYAIVPVGGEAWWEEPHDRAARFGGGAA